MNQFERGNKVLLLLKTLMLKMKVYWPSIKVKRALNTTRDVDHLLSTSVICHVCPPQGDCEDHTTLLCSLLLGFGLDAYVCVGTKAKVTPHTWVLTRGTDGSITFWESLTAHRSNFLFLLLFFCRSSVS